jgi:hypothetical protein
MSDTYLMPDQTNRRIQDMIESGDERHALELLDSFVAALAAGRIESGNVRDAAAQVSAAMGLFWAEMEARS